MYMYQNHYIQGNLIILSSLPFKIVYFFTTLFFIVVIKLKCVMHVRCVRNYEQGIYYKSKGEEHWLPLLILWLFRCDSHITLFTIYLKSDHRAFNQTELTLGFESDNSIQKRIDLISRVFLIFLKIPPNKNQICSVIQ